MEANRGAVGSKFGLLGPASILVVAASLAAACSSSSPSTPNPGDDGGMVADTGMTADASGSDATKGSGSEGGGSETGSANETGAGGGDTGAGGGDAGSIVVTSPAFMEGQTIPDVYTCAGADTSPEIDWTAGPASALSYALVVTDLTNAANIHWVVWDLPPSTRSLPALLPGTPTLTTPVSANQVDLRTSPDAGTPMNGYFGPCPRGNLHSYGFTVHALDVAVLPGVTTTSRSADVKPIVLSHTLAMGTLTGTSSATMIVDAGGQ